MATHAITTTGFAPFFIVGPFSFGGEAGCHLPARHHGTARAVHVEEGEVAIRIHAGGAESLPRYLVGTPEAVLAEVETWDSEKHHKKVAVLRAFLKKEFCEETAHTMRVRSGLCRGCEYAPALCKECQKKRYLWGMAAAAFEDLVYWPGMVKVHQRYIDTP